MNEDMRNYLRAAVISKCNVLVSGGTAGKTTLLNALSNYIPEGACHHSRGLRELQLQLAHTVTESTSEYEGGEVTIGDLMKNALRMRPDRIIVGEVRGAEALDMLQAMNTGHEGPWVPCIEFTEDALQRLVTMITMGGGQISPETSSKSSAEPGCGGPSGPST